MKSWPIQCVSTVSSCDGRVVKAFDSKSNGIFPRRFESYSQRWCVLYTTIFLNSISLQNWPRWGSNPQSSDSKSDALSIGPRGRCSILNIFDWYLTNAILYHNECKSGFGSVFCRFKLLKVYIDSGCILCTYCISYIHDRIYLCKTLLKSWPIECVSTVSSCDGRVVKAFD